MLEAVDKPTAVKLKQFVDPAYLLGLPPYDALPATGGATGRRPPAGRRKRPPVLFFFLDVKRQHPTKVALVRVSKRVGGHPGMEEAPAQRPGQSRGPPNGLLTWQVS